MYIPIEGAFVLMILIAWAVTSHFRTRAHASVDENENPKRYLSPDPETGIDSDMERDEVIPKNSHRSKNRHQQFINATPPSKLELTVLEAPELDSKNPQVNTTSKKTKKRRNGSQGNASKNSLVNNKASDLHPVFQFSKEDDDLFRSLSMDIDWDCVRKASQEARKQKSSKSIPSNVNRKQRNMDPLIINSVGE